MSAGKLNLVIEQGATFNRPIELKDGEDNPIDLTGASISALAKEKLSDRDVLFAFTATITDAVSGKFKFGLTADETTALEINSGVYDIDITYPSGVVDRLLQGTITVSKGVNE